MLQRTSVVPNPPPLNEVDFHAAMLECISRQIGRHGHATVAQTMCLSTKQLNNVLAGAFPRVDRLSNLRSLDRDALDPIHRVYGERSVPRDAVCSSDPISSKMAALLSKTIEMECPTSEGGHTATLSEILGLCACPEDEAALRNIARVCAGWLEMVDSYRSGSRPNLRAVADR